MSSVQDELDVFEMERMVARALLALIEDDPTHQPITPKRLASRTGLSVRRVREVTNEWNLQTVSGEDYLLTPDAVERARAVLSRG